MLICEAVYSKHGVINLLTSLSVELCPSAWLILVAKVWAMLFSISDTWTFDSFSFDTSCATLPIHSYPKYQQLPGHHLAY